MKDDVGVRKLLELVFVKKFQITAEMSAPDSSFPACLLINDFSLKLRHILLVRQVIAGLKSTIGVLTYTWDKLATHEAYVKGIVFNCLKEQYCHQNVFDNFISVCSVVSYFSAETFNKEGVNFDDLNCDIMMEFYKVAFKKSFLRRGGFQRLVEYIHRHKFLKWNLDMDDLADPSTLPNVEMQEKLEKVLKEEGNVIRTIKPGIITMTDAAASLAKIILSTTSVELPTLPSDQDSNRTVDASRSNDKATTAEDIKFESLEEVIEGRSNSDSNTKHVAEENEEIARCERVVQAVMRHNQSRTSDLVTSDNHILKKSDGILKHLKDAVESLMDVLDEYDKE